MVYIILLNWNGWRDTVQCLESIFRSQYTQFRVIVCDNLSMDDSISNIRAWACGELNAPGDIHETLFPLISPPVSKPVPFSEYEKNNLKDTDFESVPDTPLVIIHNKSNNGFSAGNNSGIFFATKRNARYIWLLNNDTVIKPDTLGNLVEYMETHSQTGILGAMIYSASNPAIVQTAGGGVINSFTGLDRFCLSSDRVTYIAGTSLFVREKVFQETGLLDETFFFYWEDVDFCTRAETTGWALAVDTRAIVYHKFSASVGSSSLKSDLFKVSSLIRYFKKHWPFRWIFPVVFNVGGMLINRILRYQYNRLIPIIKEALIAVSYHPKPNDFK